MDANDLAAAMADFKARKARASNRQVAIQRLCCSELEARGLHGAEIEVALRGAYRDKSWDVGLVVDGEPRLAISCKSIIGNHAGTVPNRVDDMLGEAVSLHRAYEGAVLGYLFMMSRRDESAATAKRTQKLGGLTPARLQELHAAADFWFERLVEGVTRASGRSGPDDVPEKFEVVSCSQIDFDTTPFGVRVHGSGHGPAGFFDELVRIYHRRFP